MSYRSAGSISSLPGINAVRKSANADLLTLENINKQTYSLPHCSLFHHNYLPKLKFYVKLKESEREQYD